MRFSLGEGYPALQNQLVNVLIDTGWKNTELNHGRSKLVEEIFVGDTCPPDFQKGIHHFALILTDIGSEKVEAKGKGGGGE